MPSNTNDLRETAAREAAAAARSLAAAERAVDDGRLNVAKVLRAHALGARQRALLLTRLADEHEPASRAIALALEDVRATAAALALAGDTASAAVLRSAQSAERVLHTTLDALQTARDVSESEVAQILWACEVCGLIVEAARPEICPSCGCIGGEFMLFPPFFSGTAEHIARKQPAEITAQLSADGDRLAALLGGSEDASLRWHPAEDEWCAKEIAGHMLDIADLALRRLRAAAAKEPPPTERTLLPWKLLETENYPAMPHGEIAARFSQTLADLLALLEGLDAAGWRMRIDMMSGKTLAVDVGSWVANHNTAHLQQIRDRLATAS